MVRVLDEAAERELDAVAARLAEATTIAADDPNADRPSEPGDEENTEEGMPTHRSPRLG
jgi:hypothetical protein